MGKHTTGAGRRIASARAVSAGGTQVRGLVNVSNRVETALRDTGISRQELSSNFDTNFRVGDNGVITVTGSGTGTRRMARALGQAGGQQLGRIKILNQLALGNMAVETRWRIVE